MTAKRYPAWDEAIIQAAANSSLTGTVKAMIVDSAAYTYSDAHQFLSDVPAPARTVISTALTTKTYTGGAFDADDVTMSFVSGPQSEYIIIFLDTGVETTSRLVAFIDAFNAGMPITPNGNNILISWDNGPNRIFKLGV